MANIVKTTAPFHDLINGVRFFPVDDIFLSEHIGDDVAESFLGVAGYRLASSSDVPDAPPFIAPIVVPTTSGKKPTKAAKAAAAAAQAAQPAVTAPQADEQAAKADGEDKEGDDNVF